MTSPLGDDITQETGYKRDTLYWGLRCWMCWQNARRNRCDVNLNAAKRNHILNSTRACDRTRYHPPPHTSCHIRLLSQKQTTVQPPILHFSVYTKPIYGVLIMAIT